MSQDAVSVGRRVREMRQERGLSAQTLATLSGLSRASIARIEAGSANPALDTLARLASTLGVSTTALLDEAAPDGSRDDAGASSAGDPHVADGVAQHSAATAARRGVETTLIGAGTRRRQMRSEQGLYWRLELPPSSEPQSVEVAVWGRHPDANREFVAGHPEDEFLIVVEGLLDVTVEERTYRLSEGDAIYVVGSQPHMFTAVGDQVVRAIVMLLRSRPATLVTTSGRPD